MNVRWGDFLLVVTLVAAAATAASGQGATLAAASSDTPGAAPIPDFSGIWGTHPSASSRRYRVPAQC
jgi:hypothetical protein